MELLTACQNSSVISGITLMNIPKYSWAAFILLVGKDTLVIRITIVLSLLTLAVVTGLYQFVSVECWDDPTRLMCWHSSSQIYSTVLSSANSTCQRGQMRNQQEDRAGPDSQQLWSIEQPRLEVHQFALPPPELICCPWGLKPAICFQQGYPWRIPIWCVEQHVKTHTKRNGWHVRHVKFI